MEDFGSLILSDITRVHIEKWRVKRSQTYRTRIIKGKRTQVPIGPGTINRNIEKLSAVFNKAIEFGYLDHNPIKGIKKLKVENPNRIRFLSEQEYKRLLLALDKRENKLRLAREHGNQWRNIRHYASYPDLKELTFVRSLETNGSICSLY